MDGEDGTQRGMQEEPCTPVRDTRRGSGNKHLVFNVRPQFELLLVSDNVNCCPLLVHLYTGVFQERLM